MLCVYGDLMVTSVCARIHHTHCTHHTHIGSMIQVLSLDRLHTLDVSFAAAATDIISFLDYPNLQSLTLTTMQVVMCG